MVKQILYYYTDSDIPDDKELLEYLILPPTDEMEDNIRNATLMINENLVSSNEVDSYSRKIMRI